MITYQDSYSVEMLFYLLAHNNHRADRSGQSCSTFESTCLISKSMPVLKQLMLSLVYCYNRQLIVIQVVLLWLYCVHWGQYQHDWPILFWSIDESYLVVLSYQWYDKTLAVYLSNKKTINNLFILYLSFHVNK